MLPAKLRKLRCDIVHALKAGMVSARGLAKIMGQCIAMTKAIVPGKLLLCNIYHVIALRRDWEDKDLKLTSSAIEDLQWWLSALKGWNGAPLCSLPVDLQIETDASASGWGSWMQLPDKSVKQAAGIWNKEVSFRHSNFRELLAVLKAIQSFREDLTKFKHIQVLSDNIVTVAYINHLSGPCSDLSDLM